MTTRPNSFPKQPVLNQLFNKNGGSPCTWRCKWEMFLHLCKRLKPFVLLLLLTILGLFVMIRSVSVFVKRKNEDKEFNIYPKLTKQNHENNNTDIAGAEVNKHLSFLRQDLTKLLNLYQAEGTRFRKQIRIVQKTPLLRLKSRRNVGKQNVVCSKHLFLLIQVHSSPENFMNRHAIRLSWGNMKHFIGQGNFPKR